MFYAKPHFLRDFYAGLIVENNFGTNLNEYYKLKLNNK